MEINDRITTILQTEGLTAKAFSEIIDVERSSISHLLSGRNKPSFDFLEKFFRHFPNYSPIWLISGKGEMIQVANVNRQIKPTVVQRTLFDSPSIVETEMVKPSCKVDNKQTKEMKTDVTFVTNKETSPLEEKNEMDKEKKKEIERIVIFYTNGSFETFSELKKA